MVQSSNNPTAATTRMVPLDSIRTDAASQSRVKVRTNVVHEYAKLMKQQIAEGGLVFPPVVLFTDGQAYWVGDGFHRVFAAREASQTEILAAVVEGKERDALLHSISANTEHGLPRTTADKRKAVSLLLADPEWCQWNDKEISRRCCVSPPTVGRMRKRLSVTMLLMGQRLVKRGDTTYQMSLRGSNASSDHPAVTKQVETADATFNERPQTVDTALSDSLDRLGIPIRPQMAEAFAALSHFEMADLLCKQLAELVDQIAKQAGGEELHQQVIRRVEDGKPLFYSPELHRFRQKLSESAPHAGYCPLCHAKHRDFNSPACKYCKGRGWLSRFAFETCPEHELHSLQSLRTRDGMPRRDAS